MTDNKQVEKKSGRPTGYTEEIGKEICSRIAEGKSVRSIVKDKEMPSSSMIFRWLLDEDKKRFREQYGVARNIQAELMFEELVEIADREEQDVMRDRLRVDTRKWYLSKVLPKKYGEKIDVTSDGEKIDNITVNIVDAHQPTSDTSLPEDK